MILSSENWKIIIMTGLEELTKCIKKLSADAVNTILDAVKHFWHLKVLLTFLIVPIATAQRLSAMDTNVANSVSAANSVGVLL